MKTALPLTWTAFTYFILCAEFSSALGNPVNWPEPSFSPSTSTEDTPPSAEDESVDLGQTWLGGDEQQLQERVALDQIPLWALLNNERAFLDQPAPGFHLGLNFKALGQSSPGWIHGPGDLQSPSPHRSIQVRHWDGKVTWANSYLHAAIDIDLLNGAVHESFVNYRWQQNWQLILGRKMVATGGYESYVAPAYQGQDSVFQKEFLPLGRSRPLAEILWQDPSVAVIRAQLIGAQPTPEASSGPAFALDAQLNFGRLLPRLQALSYDQGRSLYRGLSLRWLSRHLIFDIDYSIDHRSTDAALGTSFTASELERISHTSIHLYYNLWGEQLLHFSLQDFEVQLSRRANPSPRERGILIDNNQRQSSLAYWLPFGNGLSFFASSQWRGGRFMNPASPLEQSYQQLSWWLVNIGIQSTQVWSLDQKFKK